MPQTMTPTTSPSNPVGNLPATLGDLRASKEFTEAYVSRSVKDELRANLIRRLQDQASAKNASLPSSPASSALTIRSCRRSSTPSSRARTSSCSACAARRRAASCARSPSCSIPLPPTSPDRRFATIPIAPSQVRTRPHRRARRGHAHRLDDTRRSLRRKARHAGCHRCRPDRRSRSHQGRALRLRSLERTHHALWPAAARQPRHLRCQRAARSRRQDPGRALQHHAGRRCAD